jgi:fructose-specific component phosphotransferase system IIB-like protein
MKKLIITALLVVGMTTYAQHTKESSEKANMERMTPEQRQQRQLKKLTTDLNLNSEQQVQIKQLLAEQSVKRENRIVQKEASTEEMRSKRESAKNKMQEEKIVLVDKMKVILTPEQFITWKANQEKMKQRALSRNRDKRTTKMEN